VIEQRDYAWDRDAAPDDAILDTVREAVFGDIPAYVLNDEGKRAKGSDVGKIKDQLADALRNTDGYNMTGYSVVFNQWTNIRDQDGVYVERVAPGAVARAIKDRGDRIPVMYDHGRSTMYGNLPIAAPRAVWEDSHGLFAWDRVHQAPVFDAIRENIRTGSIWGQSFRFTVMPGGDSWESAKGSGLRRRTLTSLDLVERGPVTFPAYHGTDVAVRSSVVVAEVESFVRALPLELRVALRESIVLLDGGATVERQPGAMIQDEGTDERAALSGTGDLAAAMDEQTPRVTRRDLQRLALPVLIGDPDVQSTGSAA